MKTLKCFLALFAFVGLMLVGCSDQSQSPVSPNDQMTLEKNTIRSFTSTEGPSVTNPLYIPGTMHVVNGKVVSKGNLQNTFFSAIFSDGGPDLLSGDGVLELNSVYDEITFEGHTWGKLTITPTNPDAKGGVWEITWHGKLYFDPLKGVVAPLKWVGHGKGGAVNGMQFFCDDTIIYLDPLTWSGGGGTNCYIKVHK